MKKEVKRLFAVLLSVILVFCLASCNGDKTDKAFKNLNGDFVLLSEAYVPSTLPTPYKAGEGVYEKISGKHIENHTVFENGLRETIFENGVKVYEVEFNYGGYEYEYDTYNLTAYEYARFGFKMLHLDFVFSPIYGFKQSVDNVLTSILNWIEGTLSADGYTALNLTADDYTALNLSAADYYSYNG